MAHSGSRQMEEHGLPEIHPVTSESAVEGGTSSGRACKSLVMVSNISQYGQSGGEKIWGNTSAHGRCQRGLPLERIANES